MVKIDFFKRYKIIFLSLGTCLTSEQYMTGMDRNTDEGNTIEANTRYMWKVSNFLISFF